MHVLTLRLRPAVLALALAGAAAIAAPASATTAVSGELNAVANAKINSGANHTDTDSQSWAAVPATLNTSVFAHAAAVVGDHNSHVDSFGTAEATWVSADSGAVDFTGYGWDFSVPSAFAQQNAADLDANRPGSGLDWSYSFIATQNGQFTMAYDVNATGDGFGLYGWNISFSGAGGGDTLTTGHDLDPTQSGVFSRALVAGQFYTVGLAGNPNISHFGTSFDASQMNGNFDWQITSSGAPEPTTWALMIGGFGLAGAALRRRRVAAA